MGRILAIDYGKKRTGLAVTDPLRIIATPLDTVLTNDLLSYLAAYVKKETVDEFVVGMPKTLKNEDSEIAPLVRVFVEELKKIYPEKKIHLEDMNGNKLIMDKDGITIESIKEIKMKAATDMKMEGGSNVNLKGGSQTKVEGGAGAEISSGGATNVKGSIVNLN